MEMRAENLKHIKMEIFYGECKQQLSYGALANNWFTQGSSWRQNVDSRAESDPSLMLDCQFIFLFSHRQSTSSFELATDERSWIWPWLQNFNLRCKIKVCYYVFLHNPYSFKQLSGPRFFLSTCFLIRCAIQSFSCLRS